jgi:xanthine dehydrogenase accessory factor
MPRVPDLHDALGELDRMARTERRAAMATLVSTEGTTPQKSGATMWVGEGGRILGSVTIGGCVDAQVVASSEEVLRTERPALLSLTLRDEEGWDLGLTCGGTLRVLVEPVRLDADTNAITSGYDAVRRAIGAGQRVVLVAELPGSADRLVVHEDGSTTGTLGDATLDTAARAEALEVVARGVSSTACLAVQGSDVELFFGLYAPPPRLLVFGATHVAMPLVSYGAVLGWRATVIDARERFATRERFPDAEELLVGNVAMLAERQRYDASTFVVIVAHDYKFELPILRTVLSKQPAYVGLLAGRARARALKEFLAAEGIDPAALDRIHIPIGLKIGAQTGPEIALAIAAQIVAVRKGAL